MTVDVIVPGDASSYWLLIRDLELMRDQGVIKQHEYKKLSKSISDLLRAALGLQ